MKDPLLAKLNPERIRNLQSRARIVNGQAVYISQQELDALCELAIVQVEVESKDKDKDKIITNEILANEIDAFSLRPVNTFCSREYTNNLAAIMIRAANALRGKS